MGYYTIKKKFALGLGVLMLSSWALAAHKVTIIKAEPVRTTVQLNLTADVSDSNEIKSATLAGRNYRLSIQLPKDIQFDLSIGSTANVVLPTIHQLENKATVTSISKSHIELMLYNQVQLLDGQRVRVTLPVKPIHLYSIPFQSIYSPRGTSTEVFVLTEGQKVKLVAVVPLKILANGRIIVSSNELDAANVVVQGTDNLITGDIVQVIDQKEAQL